MYGITREGKIVTSDTSKVSSDCHQIVLLNTGDTPCTVAIDETDIVFDLAGKTADKTDYLIFGSMNEPCHWERSRFNIAFGALVTTRQLTVMRITLKEES